MRLKSIMIGLIILTGLSMPASGTDHDSVLRFCTMAEPQSLDPHVATGIPESRIINALYEGLTTLDQKTLKPRPGMAESWSVADDQVTWSFTLRKASWSNGDPVTAQDFVDSWQRMLRLDPVSKYMEMLYIIKGAKPYAERATDDFSTVGVVAKDSRTLQVTLISPTPYFLEVLAHYTFFPVHHAKSRHRVNAENSRPGKLVGNGAFTLEAHRINDKIVVKKNPLYWDASSVRLSAVEFYPIDNLDTAYLMFRKGELDVVDDVPQSSLEKMIEDKEPTLHVHPYLGTYYYRFNVTKKPFDDVRVRKALCLAVSKRRITRKVTGAGELPATTMVPPGMTGYDGPKGLAYDKVAARKLLAEAGYPEGKGFPEIELLYNTSENHKNIALEIAQQLKLNLGITVKLVNKEWKVYLDDLTKLNYTLSRAGWIGDYADPNTFLELMVTGNGNNRTGWSHSKYDGLIKQAFRTADPAERLKLLAQAETILIEDEVPVMPIYTYVSKKLLSPSVRGWIPNVRDVHPLKDISLTR